MKIEDLQPGRLVLVDGVAHLVEIADVAITLTLQRIQSQRDNIGSSMPYGPVFMQLTGKMGDPQLSEPYLTLLVPQGEDDAAN